MLLRESFLPLFIRLLLKNSGYSIAISAFDCSELWGDGGVVTKREHRSLPLCPIFVPARLGGTQAKPSKGRDLGDAEQLESAGAPRFCVSRS